MMRLRPVVRTLESFHREPPSVRHAIRAIVAATVVATVLGGFLVWLFDRKDFATLGEAMWWALQTVTTVGYGDVTPKNTLGRIIGATVLLYSVTFLSILTAAITTSFVERARRQRGTDDRTDIIGRLDEITSRLDRVERLLAASDTDSGGGQPSA